MPSRNTLSPRQARMATALLVMLAISIAHTALAAPANPTDRKLILDVARPYVEAMTGQPVKYAVTHANVDGQWALVTGTLVAPTGKPLNWAKVPYCEGDTDKLLWMVLAKADGQWRPAQIQICAAEPPQWSLDKATSLWWPCGVYTGLEDAKGKSLEALCKTRSAKP